MLSQKMENLSLIMNQETYVSPNYSIIFDFERNFDKERSKQWMIEHWHHAYYYIVFYLLIVFGIQAYMRNRPRLELSKFLATWNIFLAAFSIFGICRTLPEMIHVFNKFGFTYSVCNSSYLHDVKVTAFWSWMFTLSKVPELCDTLFIVLRKQPLIFLHWYHHTTVLIYAWYAYTKQIASGRWYMVMNFFVHSLMYSYFATRALRFKTPRSLAFIITSLQILQMIGGFYVTYFSYATSQKGEFCQQYDNVSIYGLLMYASYFVLFARFFYNAYVSSTSKEKKSA